jgi:hypothetical protein
MIVSGTPLFRYLSTILTDQLYLTSMYQLKEVEYYKNTIKAKKVNVLPPINYLELLGHYKSTLLTPFTKGSIGVYTSGIWKRKQEGTYYSPEMERKEFLIFKGLNELLKRKLITRVLFYFHPLEKFSEEDYQKAIGFYLDFFESGLKPRVEFSGRDKNTWNTFNEVDLAVTTVSNTIIDRLFSGYKMLMVPFEEDIFPIKPSGLYNISAFTEEQLVDKTQEFLQMDVGEYFRINKLENYHMEAFERKGS